MNSSYLGKSDIHILESRECEQYKNLLLFSWLLFAYKCKGERCEVCKDVLETDTFTCSNDQTTYKINHKFDCNEKCLVYLITCNKCLKQYVGQTVDMFRSRWNNYKDNSRKFDRGEDCMQRHLYEHF